jgi:hypothetical protein
MSSKLANNFLEQLLKKEIDFDADDFKIILMASGFVFNRVTHAEYADVSGSELATAYGYTAGGLSLSGVAVSQDDTANAGVVTWGNASWTISGGNITASGAIIYDDTHASDHIVGYIDFGGDQTCLDGGVASVATPTVRILG